MPTHLPCMREDLDLLLARAPWRIALPRMPCQVTQALTRNLIQVNLHVSYSTCIPFKFCLTALSTASTKEHPAASHDNETEDEDGEAERLVEHESYCTSMPW